MAILNIADLLSEVLSNGTLPNDNRLIFTKDKHIITRGIDFLEDYKKGGRGLVPICSDSNKILSDNGWASITTDMLPLLIDNIDSTTEDLSKKILTAQAIKNYLNSYFVANDAMVFKGGVGSKDDIPKSGYQAGWTYRSTGKFTLTETKLVEIGDMLIANSDADPNQTTLNTDHWTVIQANINGYAEITINGSKYQFYGANNYNASTFYAPTTRGIENQVLLSSGTGAPVWANQSTLDAGLLGGTAKGDLLTSVTASNGQIKVTVGGTSKTGIASGSWDITSAKVANALNISSGLRFADVTDTTYDGSVARTLLLQSATTSTIGGVIIGNNISVDSTGTISLTSKNITDALGYVPTNPQTAGSYILTLGEANSAINSTTSITDPYINLVGPNSSSLQVKTSGRLTAKGINGILTIGITSATDTSYGGIKVAKSNSNYSVTTLTSDISSDITSGKYYGVEIDKNGKAFVHVPCGTIKIGGTSIGSSDLNFIPTGDIYIKADPNTDNVVDLSFGLAWYNISTGAYEYDTQYN